MRKGVAVELWIIENDAHEKVGQIGLERIQTVLWYAYHVAASKESFSGGWRAIVGLRL